MTGLSTKPELPRRIRLAVLLLLLAALSSAWPAAAAEAEAPAQARLSVQGMECPNCERTVESVLRQVDGVSAADADRRNETAIVTFDPNRADPRDMARALNSETYYRAKAVAVQPVARQASLPADKQDSGTSGAGYTPLALGAAALAGALLILVSWRRRHAARLPAGPRPEGP